MSDAGNWLEAVLRVRESLSAMPTDVAPQLERLADVRCVVFDIYGTLVISGSGDVGSADQHDDGARIREALAAVGWEGAAVPTIDQLHEQIRSSNEQRKSDVCPKPEVDIVEIWRQTLVAAGMEPWASRCERVVRLSAEYEARANPTWPMPGAAELINELRNRSMPLGIVSNAQAFTIPLIEDVAGGPLADRGFDLDFCVFSFRYRQAKPGPRLFDVLREGLKRRQISPNETLYVGNDMLNDMWAASQAGLRTAWFAGDARSLRARSDDPRCRSFRPDLVLTSLGQLSDCIE